MYKLISFDRTGEVLEHAGQVASFYALIYNGHILEYFTSIQALKEKVWQYKVLETAFKLGK